MSTAGARPRPSALFTMEGWLYSITYDTDLGDGLEDEEVHHDPPEKREAAMRMALNIVQYALTH